MDEEYDHVEEGARLLDTGLEWGWFYQTVNATTLADPEPVNRPENSYIWFTAEKVKGIKPSADGSVGSPQDLIIMYDPCSGATLGERVQDLDQFPHTHPN